MENKIYYLLYPRDYDEYENQLIQSVDYDKLIGYVFKKIHETRFGDKVTFYFRSIFPNTDQMLTVDKEYFEKGKSGLKPAPMDMECVLQEINDKGTNSLPKCKWYGSDGCCFLHGAGCSPMYRQYGALRKWDIPLDEEREQE